MTYWKKKVLLGKNVFRGLKGFAVHKVCAVFNMRTHTFARRGSSISCQSCHCWKFKLKFKLPGV